MLKIAPFRVISLIGLVACGLSIQDFSEVCSKLHNMKIKQCVERKSAATGNRR